MRLLLLGVTSTCFKQEDYNYFARVEHLFYMFDENSMVLRRYGLNSTKRRLQKMINSRQVGDRAEPVSTSKRNN